MQLIRIPFKIYAKLARHLRPIIYRKMAQFESWLVGGKIEWPKSVIATVHTRIDGLGVVKLEDGVRIGFRPAPSLGNGQVLIQARPREAIISIGPRSFISNNVSLVALQSIVIGSDCLIGDRVSIVDSDFHETNPSTRHQSTGITLPVQIGNNVWIGSNTMILKGVTVGENTVIGSMSLVCKSLPSNCIAAGNPAKVIKYFE